MAYTNHYRSIQSASPAIIPSHVNPIISPNCLLIIIIIIVYFINRHHSAIQDCSIMSNKIETYNQNYKKTERTEEQVKMQLTHGERAVLTRDGL